ncbi:hypothetical protein [Stenotrophomonas sp. 22385]|uniref:hypothetical protein n=1 Tax=Stenotrophomonas sp. 22385 TaxID=3453915 RepID=UPI003F82C7EF
MIFNPVRLRDNGFSEEMIHYFMATSYDPSRPMGNVAIAKIENCVFGVLVGRFESVEPMLPRAVGWIDQAISIQENFGKNLHFYRSRLYHARGVASWMLDGFPHEGDWDGARVTAEAAWRLGDRVWTRHEIVSGGGLDDYMAYSWLAGPDHWEAGMEMYEHWMGDQSKFSISGNLSPKKFVYALLLDATARQPSSQEKLFAAGRRMLRENLQENWLGGGQGIRAATWLQIVYGVGEPGLTPSETLLRAYDDMPDVTSPF